MMRHIVVPLDGSARAESALSLATHIAQANGGMLSLIRVVGTPTQYAWYSGDMVTVLPEVVEAERKEAVDYLAQIATAPALQHIKVKTQVIEGIPANEILSFAQVQRADLIIMCSHGGRGLKRWMLGSVAHKVARHSEVPVLVLREGERLPIALTEKGTRSVRVLVPLDGSTLAEEALEPAIALSQALSAPNQAAIHLLSVLPAYKREMTTTQGAAFIIQGAEAYLKQMEKAIQQRIGPQTTLTVTSALTQDVDVALALATYGEGMPAEKEHPQRCDLIAMATHGRGGLTRWVMGSIAERVLEKTRLPLLVVRPKRLAKGELTLDTAHEVTINNEEEKEQW